jgi:hypothetical protein
MRLQDEWNWPFTPDDEDDTNPPHGWLSARSAIGRLADRKSIRDPAAALLEGCQLGQIKTWARALTIDNRHYGFIFIPREYWFGVTLPVFRSAIITDQFTAQFQTLEKPEVVGNAKGVFFETDGLWGFIGLTITQQKAKASQRRGKNYNAADYPLVIEMQRLINEGKSATAWDAALALAPKALGKGTEVSKAQRLHKKFTQGLK